MNAVKERVVYNTTCAVCMVFSPSMSEYLTTPEKKNHTQTHTHTITMWARCAGEHETGKIKDALPDVADRKINTG